MGARSAVSGIPRGTALRRRVGPVSVVGRGVQEKVTLQRFVRRLASRADVSSVIRRWWKCLYRVIAAGCYAGTLFLALHHPLAPIPLAVALTLWAIAVRRWPSVWLFGVPALLPVMNFLPWTGWVALDEFDLLLLATAAGGYAAPAARRRGPRERRGGE